MTDARVVVTALLVAACAGSAAGQPLPRRSEAVSAARVGIPPQGPHESPGLPLPGTPATTLGPPFSTSRLADELPVFITQVNISAMGLNIIGDAANEPTICIDPNAPDRLAIGWRQFATIASSFREAGNACSLDGGRTWHNNPVLTPGVFRSDPVLAAGSDGTFYFNTLTQAPGFRCDVSVSTDGGQTWSEPRFAFGGDKSWMTIDNSGGPGDGILHQAWSDTSNPTPPNTYARSTNGAATWSTPSFLDLDLKWGTLAVGIDGELYVVGRTPSGEEVRVARSFNAGNPATPAVTFDPYRVVPLHGPVRGIGGTPNPGGLLGQVWIDVDRSAGPHRGRLIVLAAVNPDGTDSADLSLAWSDDRGQTWSAPVRVNDDAPGASNWQWFPALSIAPSGRVDVTWYDSHESGNPVLNKLYYSSSSDGGATWTPGVAVSPEFNSTVGYPMQNKIGDYTHQVSDLTGCSVAWAATFTGGQDVYMARIGPWDCNKNGVADETDIALGTEQDCNGDGRPDSCQIAAGYLPDRNNNGVPDTCEAPCRPDLTHGAIAGRPGYGVPDAILDNDDFFYYLAQFFAGNAAVADMTATAVPGSPGYGIPNGIVNNDDFFYYLSLFAAGC